MLHASKVIDTKAPTSLETRELTVRFGGHVAVDGISCQFHPGELTAIVGPNGAGKTTYFNLISGQVAASAGSVLLADEEITRHSVAARTDRGLGRAFQLTNLFPKLSVLENVRLVIQSRMKRDLNLWSIASDHRDLIQAAEQVLESVQLLSVAHMAVAALPHGDQRKLEVAMLIAMKPSVYMFDEPTAGMSVDEVPVVLDLIAGIQADPAATVLLVEHKMDVIRLLANRIIVLHNGALVADGLPGEVMASTVVQEAYLGKELADV